MSMLNEIRGFVRPCFFVSACLIMGAGWLCAEEAISKPVAIERVVSGEVGAVIPLERGATLHAVVDKQPQVSSLITDTRNYRITLKSLPTAYSIVLTPDTAITAGDKTIYPAAVKPNEDFLSVKYTDTVKEIAINSVMLEKTRASHTIKRNSMAFGLSLTAVILLAVSGALKKVRGGLFVGQDNRYSNSKFQMTLWVFAVILTYTTLFFERYFAGTDRLSFSLLIGIPDNLGILMGISAGSFIGAKVITSQQVNSKTVAKPPAARPSLLDLITDDNKVVDLGDLQMFAWTLVGVLIYVLSFIRMWQFIDLTNSTMLPNIDSSLLVLTGVSQAAYIGKKLVPK